MNDRSPVQRALAGIRENPLGLILVGLALGLLAGALAPVTDVERRKMAPVRDELIGQAQQAVGDVLDHSKRVIDDTVAAATDSAAKHGGDLVTALQADFKLTPAAPEA